MELISSAAAEVSSSEAACLEEPSARDWLEEAISAAAEAICSAPSASSETVWDNCRLSARIMYQERPMPSSSEMAPRDNVSHMEVCTVWAAEARERSETFRFQSTR
jgi:hypothetical protein